MFQVLEHLRDPVEAVARQSSHLKPGGRLIIGVPNFSSWQSRFTRGDWFHLDVPRHLFHHSPESMKVLAAAAGMRVDTIHFVSPEHDPYGWVQSVLNKAFGNKNRLTKLLMGMVRPVPSDGVTFFWPLP